ncbi:flavin-containing monooxygenase [Nocardia higoensis]|uniref:flavin-containing monooxygenase n=1 Tax=Nocardia higoensis TaxID=228599 RepID=UPI0002FE6F3F|nr:NAD(P)/FAD-dependent oxidoreductase [Nocardia higoensis]
MTTKTSQENAADGAEVLDVLVIGAGIAGLYQLYSLLPTGLSVRVVEAGDDIGGTWYWNRYPGARFDSESYTYAYFFSQELLDEWDWSEHFAGQPEIERYLQRVVEKFDLRRHITFGTRVLSAEFDEAAREWRLRTSTGERIRARAVITAIGMLSQPQFPPAPGREDFRGVSAHTALWPAEGIDLAGKRVAVVGCGSSGVQIVGAIAGEVGELTVFQRTANWCTPLNNSPISAEELADIRSRYPEIHRSCMQSFAGFVHQFEEVSAHDRTPEERLAFYEELYRRPGFAKLLGNYQEVLFSPEINAEYSEFLAGKIRERVSDPATADRLIPKDHGYGAKRPPFENGYFEAFNQSNVSLVDLRETPIERITETGIQTTAGHHEFDVIVYATGFDAITGAFDAIDIRNQAGETLKDFWDAGPHTFLGASSPGFPNLFFIAGPHSTGGNVPRAIERQVDFLTGVVKHMAANGYTRAEATAEAEAAWTAHVLEGIQGTVVAAEKDWAFGTNTPGKKIAYRHYAGGIITYSNKCDEVEADDYRGFAFA